MRPGVLMGLPREATVNLSSVRVLTWATAVAALLSALLLAGEDAGLPDLGPAQAAQAR